MNRVRMSPWFDMGASDVDAPSAAASARNPGRRMLITAGPTHEPIDAVRFIGNRSSGRMGVAIAEAAANAGWQVTLLLGPMTIVPQDARVRVSRFRTCEDLRGLLKGEVGSAEVLVMAAAVADYRPKVDPAFQGGKFRRTGQKMMLELESTPDLLAEVAKARKPEQLMVGFALEPRDELVTSARDKMVRKGVDMVVANPLETMDSAEIEGMIVSGEGEIRPEGGRMSKVAFAAWLVERIGIAVERRGGAKGREAGRDAACEPKGTAGDITHPSTNTRSCGQKAEA